MPTATIDEIIESSGKSAGDVTAWASNIVAGGRGQAVARELSLSGQALTNLQQQINNGRRSLGYLAAIVDEIGGLTVADLVAAGFGRSLTQQTQLVAGVNAITYADPLYGSDSLFLWVRQVASGTVGTITFGSNLKFADVNYVTNTFSKVTIYPFHAFPDPDDANTLKWFCVSPPNAEQTI
jgi:hypothetical protein